MAKNTKETLCSLSVWFQTQFLLPVHLHKSTNLLQQWLQATALVSETCGPKWSHNLPALQDYKWKDYTNAGRQLFPQMLFHVCSPQYTHCNSFQSIPWRSLLSLGLNFLKRCSTPLSKHVSASQAPENPYNSHQGPSFFSQSEMNSFNKLFKKHDWTEADRILQAKTSLMKNLE